MSVNDVNRVVPSRIEHNECRTVLKPGQYIVGRAPECEIVLQDTTVSRRHAAIRVAANCVSVLDLSSRNGTYVNQSRIRETTVRDGDCLLFGKVKFFFHEHPPTLVNRTSMEDPSTAPVQWHKLNDVFSTVSLSPAPKRVLSFLIEGYSEKEIGAKLRISVHTVHNHVRTIYQYFNVNSRAELLVIFLESQSWQRPS